MADAHATALGQLRRSEAINDKFGEELGAATLERKEKKERKGELEAEVRSLRQELRERTIAAKTAASSTVCDRQVHTDWRAWPG